MSRPLRILSSVLFPEPDAPTMAIISPGLTSRSNPCRATTSRSATLYILTRLSQITRGSGIVKPPYGECDGGRDRLGVGGRDKSSLGDGRDKSSPYGCSFGHGINP